MKLVAAYKLLLKYDEAQYIHMDHICSEPSTHNLKHCPLPLWDVFTEEDINIETEFSLTEKLKRRYENL